MVAGVSGAARAGAAEKMLVLTDGRAIAYAEHGDPAGYPVIALHGTPGAATKYASTGGAAAQIGLRLIAPDRWGYGRTSPHPAPTLATFAADMARLADHLGADRFAVAGVSGGGPFAAATAAVLAGRVSALALISPVGPVGMAGASRDLDAFHRLSFRMLPRVPGAMRLVFSAFRTGLALAPETAMRVAGSRHGDADRSASRDADVRAAMAEMFKAGLEHGVDGAVTDMALFSRPWDFDPGTIRAPSRLWIGSDDRNVPVRSARRLAGMIEGCVLSALDGEGHLWVGRHAGEALQWISDAVTAPRRPLRPAATK